jgi:hypothetical protein
MDPHWSPIMTAEIIPFRRPDPEDERSASLPAPFFATLPAPANSTKVEALPVDSHSSGGSVLAASAALSAACREMAASLALLIAHCEAADSLMAELAVGAEVTGNGAGTINDAALCLSHDVAQAMGAVTKAARAATQA